MSIARRSDLLVCDHCGGQQEEEVAIGWLRIGRPSGGIGVAEDAFFHDSMDACSIPCATALITGLPAGSRQHPIQRGMRT